MESKKINDLSSKKSNTECKELVRTFIDSYMMFIQKESEQNCQLKRKLQFLEVINSYGGQGLKQRIEKKLTDDPSKFLSAHEKWSSIFQVSRNNKIDESMWKNFHMYSESCLRTRNSVV